MFKVGKPLPQHLIMRRDGARFDFDDGGGMLYVTLGRPTTREKRDIRNGLVQIEVCDYKGVIFIMHKFGDMPWSDAPYNVHLSKPYTFQDMGAGMGYAIQIVLSDTNGICHVLRLVGMDHAQSVRFKELVAKQMAEPFNEARYDSLISEAYRMTTDQLRKFCRGGAM